MIAAGAFIFCLVMSIQGVALQLLPRRLFLRASSFLQIGAFAVIVSVYRLQPAAASAGAHRGAAAAVRDDGTGAVVAVILVPRPVSAAQWIAGVPDARGAREHRARRRARADRDGLRVSYFRTLRRIAEEATIVPSRRASRGGGWWRLPSFGGGPNGRGLPAAVVPFSVRTLLRSPQHRVILAFYLGMGFAAAIFFMNLSAPAPIVESGRRPALGGGIRRSAVARGNRLAASRRAS